MPRLTSEERRVISAIDSLRQQRIPTTPLAITVRSGIEKDRVVHLCERLRQLGVLGDT